MRPALLPALVFGVGAGPALAVTGPGGQACRIQIVAELPFTLVKGQPRIEAEVNGRKGWFLLRTSASGGFLYTHVAREMKIARDDTGASTSDDRPVSRIKLKSIKIGAINQSDAPFLTALDNPAEEGELGMIGRDLPGAGDMEIDWPARKVRYLKLTGCKDDASPVYWSKDYSIAEILPLDDGVIAGPVYVRAEIGGRKARAGFSTSQEYSFVPKAYALAAGVDRASFDTPPLFTDDKQLRWLVVAPAISIGEETVKAVHLMSGPNDKGRMDQPYLILGQDFFQSHRVVFAYSQNKVYFTYLGGAPFRTTAPENAKP